MSTNNAVYVTTTCPPRRRHSKRRLNNNKVSCWRNPIVVFLVTFLALGSLRFRVPARSRKAASELLLKRREARKQRRMIYVLQEEGTLGNNNNKDPQVSFRRYKAVLSVNNNDKDSPTADSPFVSTRDWATAIATASAKHLVLSELNRVIFECPYQGVFFETPPVTADMADTQPFEFVLVDAPELHTVATASPNVNAFARFFESAARNNDQAVVFANLGGDATLVCPTPPKVTKDDSNNAAAAKKDVLSTYSHLAAFVRGAPERQVTETWRTLAKTYLARLSDQPVWLSTDGMGIYWLHFRLDDRPKYYEYAPYQSLIGGGVGSA